MNISAGNLLTAMVGTVLLAAGLWRPAVAQDAPVTPDAVEPRVERRELDVAALGSENFEVTGYLGYMNVEDFGSDIVFGARLAWHLTPALFLEGSYGQVDAGRSSVERAGGGNPLSGESSNLKYYDASLGWNVLPGEVFVGEGKAWNSAFYVIGGLGAVDFADDSEFAVNVGFGFRVLPRDNVSVRAEFRDYIFESSAVGGSNTTHNLQATLNLGWYF